MQHKLQCIGALRRAARHSGKCSCPSCCRSPQPEMMNSAVYRAHSKMVRRWECVCVHEERVCVCVRWGLWSRKRFDGCWNSSSPASKSRQDRRREAAVTPRLNSFSSRFSSGVTMIYFTPPLFTSRAIILLHAGKKGVSCWIIILNQQPIPNLSMRFMSWSPSPFRKRSRLAGSIRQEQSASNRFSIISCSSGMDGLCLLNTWSTAVCY